MAELSVEQRIMCALQQAEQEGQFKLYWTGTALVAIPDEAEDKEIDVVGLVTDGAYYYD